MSPLAFALVAETLALIAALYFLIMRQPTAPAPRGKAPQEAQTSPAPRPEQELDRVRKLQELGEAKAQIGELKEQLKKAKRERFEQRQSEKAGTSLQKEREGVERAASQQLEAVRAELSQAQMESSRLKAELEMQRGKKPTIVHVPAPVAPAPVAVAPVAPAPEAERAPEPPRTRELNPAEVARIELLENRSNKDRAKAVELDTQVKRLKSNSDIQARAYKTLKTETDLLRDKYKALEKRLNRTLLERDLTLRAIQQLERETGKVAEHTAPSADELAQTDRDTEASQKAEAVAEAEAHAQAEAAAVARDAATPPPPEAPSEESHKAVVS